MAFKYIEIERVEKLTKKEFIENYYKPQKPVVITNQIEDWPAFSKWNFQFLREVAGDKIVPLYDSRKTDYTKKVNEPDFTMTMSEYIDILEKGPTDLRIFLYNLMKDVPSLKSDMKWPQLGLRLIKSLPLVFFGGQDAKVFMHYDIDFPNIFHIHFEGEKQCVLVDPKETKYMYRLPYSWICNEDIDFDNPDFEKFPALKMIKPYITKLQHGEMLYMPEGWWHYMKYLTPGFSLSLRSLAGRPANLLRGLANVAVIRYYDNWMRKRKGQSWLDYKDAESIRRTNELMNK
ncbi:cupin-like domain-containing protein [Myroides ceti]|uniref:Cupin-like domain-containing protein n=1 Tax=Paenimyroides ceti TaxID=395087 RepID=A0ABT8CZD1_9FLAO|nr:cupin-like domain-containing protein [Paenimyroides ceti]MDN3708155.1 cupin-like domain-containing protein [Paenimyroides ceti]MDN3709101.1 cupin-like domain-containing protein [Paenimyroides ceti]